MREDSRVEAALPPEADAVSISGAQRRLAACGLPLVRVEPSGEHAVEDAVWELEVEWAADDAGPWCQRVYSRTLDRSFVELHVELGRLTEEDAARVEDSRAVVGLTGPTGVSRHPLIDYHRQLQLLHTLAPNATALLDLSACDARSADWLGDAATSTVPPHPNHLFTIHAVTSQAGRAWLHTHGLHRCGVMELDIVGVPEGAVDAMQQLMCAVAKVFIDDGAPPENEIFEPGQGMPLVWLDVPTAMKHVGRLDNGGSDDRDSLHRDGRGVLFVPPRGWLRRKPRNPSLLAPLFEDEPLLYVSQIETDRMAALAVERLPRFRTLFEALGDDPMFLFLVKLGYETSDDGGHREHLWFQVHGFDGERVDGACINRPYDVPSLAEGQRDWRPLSRLSDFAIGGPLGMTHPDHVHDIEALASNPDALEVLRVADAEH